MKIYQYEIADGLQEQIEAKASVAFDCDILKPEIIQPDYTEVRKSLAFMGIDNKQADLYYLNSVLVSAGWNKNDDVFAVDQLWTAKATPVNKQFNYMHDDTDIIGHITGSAVVDREGNHISEQSAVEDLPENIDIITSAVIYKTWSEQEMRERIAELITEIEEGKWSVSMECIFSDFDYAITGPDQSNRVLARDDESSFLTKHLRAYGGTGEYQGYKVGRLLKAFYFSGKGLVAKPANPRSIIFNRDTNPFDTKAKIEFKTFLSAMEVDNMAEETQQVEDFEAKANTIQAAFDAFKVEAEAAQSEAKEKAQAFEATIAEQAQTIETLTSKVNELEESIATMHEDKKKMKEDKDKMEEENEGLKKTMKGMKRKAKLTKAGVDEETSEQILSQFDNVSEDQFDAVVALMADKGQPAPAPAPAPEPAPEPEPEPEDDGDDEEEADASELDTVEELTSASLANPEVEEEGRAIASSAAWLRESVLRTTKNLK
jgi:FtsZ-binding cell division protein ZapB